MIPILQMRRLRPLASGLVRAQDMDLPYHSSRPLPLTVIRVSRQQPWGPGGLFVSVYAPLHLQRWEVAVSVGGAPWSCAGFSQVS